MSDELKEKVEGQIDLASWTMLSEHNERGAVVIVHPDIDLVEVAVEVAQDNVTSVQGWLDSGMIFKPEESQVQAFNTQPERQFKFIIVQPYVLVQEQSN